MKEVDKQFDITNYTGIIFEVRNRMVTFNVYNDFGETQHSSYLEYFSTKLKRRWWLISAQISRLLSEMYNSGQLGSYAIHTSIRLFVSGSKKYDIKLIIDSYIGIVKFSFLIADIITRLASLYKWNPRLKYLRTYNSCEILDENDSTVILSSCPLSYSFGIQFATPDKNGGTTDFIVAKYVIPYDISSVGIVHRDCINYIEECCASGYVVDGYHSFLVVHDNQLKPFNGYCEFDVKRPAKLFIVDPAELSKKEVDYVCDFLGSR